jgi:hypothetical protein
MRFIVTVETAHTNQGMVTNNHSKHAAKRPNKLLKGRWMRMAKIKSKPTIKINLHSESTHLTPMRGGDASRGPSENKSHDRLIGVDFLNLACEGLLLEIQAGGPACRRPPSTITLVELRKHQRDASRRPPRHYQAISFTRADSLT